MFSKIIYTNYIQQCHLDHYVLAREQRIQMYVKRCVDAKLQVALSAHSVARSVIALFAKNQNKYKYTNIIIVFLHGIYLFHKVGENNKSMLRIGIYNTT
jgi:hypothetical protein